MQLHHPQPNSALAVEALALKEDLQSFAGLCGSILDLARQENQALAGQADYQGSNFDLTRKNLLQPIDSALAKLRRHRELWTRLKDQARASSSELSSLLANIQNLLMRILQLDRENQQALLRRGLVPAQHVMATAEQQPHFVAKIYGQHAKFQQCSVKAEL